MAEWLAINAKHRYSIQSYQPYAICRTAPKTKLTVQVSESNFPSNFVVRAHAPAHLFLYHLMVGLLFVVVR